MKKFLTNIKSLFSDEKGAVSMKRLCRLLCRLSLTPSSASTPVLTPDSTPVSTPDSTPSPSYHVWNLYRTEGAEFPACSTVNASQVIEYNSNYEVGLVFKGSNGLCYTVANDGYQTSPPLITVDTEFGNCNECIEG
jgi:hypothetical protein